MDFAERTAEDAEPYHDNSIGLLFSTARPRARHRGVQRRAAMSSFRFNAFAASRSCPVSYVVGIQFMLLVIGRQTRAPNSPPP